MNNERGFWEWFVGATALKHGGSSHDQSTHGNRYGASASEARELTGQVLSPQGGGYTWRHGKGSPTTGYVVALKGYTQIVPTKNLTEEVIRGYARQYRKVLKSNPKAFLGAWVEKDDTYLDISEVFDDRVEAEKAGRERGEIGIWDIAGGTTIYL